MPRKGEVRRREILPDPKYNDRMVTKFINAMMYGGKKSTAEHILYDALDMVAERTKEDPLAIFKRALENVKPNVEVRSRRVGGATYQVPVDVRPVRRISLGMRWIVQFARARGEKSMADRLAGELIDASSGRGTTMKKKEDTHRMADANKAFAHYRW
jgi:small subunit ribosomal protein S7